MPLQIVNLGALAGLAVAEIFRVGVWIAEIIVDEHRGLAGQLKAFAAFETGDEIVEPHHVGRGFGKLSAVFVAGAVKSNNIQLLFTFQKAFQLQGTGN